MEENEYLFTSKQCFEFGKRRVSWFVAGRGDLHPHEWELGGIYKHVNTLRNVVKIAGGLAFRRRDIGVH